ncbi:nuclear exosome regulator NRDE2 isoform X1 [Anopheles funestus]|uniref:nuclear exosome regulator NRDE2 isoform X1 n=1 Tax=Anopheles funestus TaxID=62324 RepID=UPI0020C61A81|nr:nuclear exosome regulator NRDE2 isoform X1 [Anopheles funestus]
MSLFPAYNTAAQATKSDPTASSSAASEHSWLTNQSFIPFGTTTEPAETISEESAPEDNQSERTDADHQTTVEVNRTETKVSKRQKSKHKKKHKKKQSKRRQSSSSSSETTDEEREKSALALPGPSAVHISEAEYYTDVDPSKIYFTVEKLYRPACPRYRLGTVKALGIRSNGMNPGKERYKRYFRVVKGKERNQTSASKVGQEEIFAREAELERSIRAEESVDKWIELVRFRQDHPIHFDSYQNHKRELTLIERARRHYPYDEKLLRLYLEAIVRVHPTDEVLNLIRRAITKDETNVTLWRSLIRNKQCAMAQCIVPDVLKLYEKSTRSLFMARRSDETMLQLFRNCATFCRQAGLCELMFGMLQHALGMNVSERYGTDGMFSSPEHFQPLIEYEELILKSGLPMNEIWLRVELLRGAFHYLPFEGGRLASDPQRMVLTDDVVGYVYPLINKSYAFELLLVALKLMKFPFPRQYDEEEAYEVDYSEQLLPLFLHVFRDRSLDGELYAFVKQLSVAPSYIKANIAHESYLELVRKCLALAIDHFEGTKSATLLTFYLQLERILVCEEKASSSPPKMLLEEGKAKPVRARVKNLLKHTHSSNQNSLLVYAEYGLLEYEMTGLSVACRKIFSTSVQVYCSTEQTVPSTSDIPVEDDNDLYHLVLTMVELLLLDGLKNEAIRALTNLALKRDELTFESAATVPPDTMKLSALQKFSDRVNRAVRHESQPDSSISTPTEQHFNRNAMINAIKAYVIYLALIRSNLTEASKQLETFLYLFNDLSNPRHRFLRQQLYEIYIQLYEIARLGKKQAHLPPTENLRSFLDIVDRALNEFPSNLYALRTVVFNDNLPWLRLRGVLGKHLTPKAVLLLVIAARYRESCTAINQEEFIPTEASPYKQRILNLLGCALKSSSTDSASLLYRNALLWRLYLRELFDQPNAPPGYSVLEQCRRTLYAALEACPWNKALYLDGASCAPQELSQLLDLMVEKQLRVHAIPEELAILREG